ncbi:MAG TPA: response regulator, partial [Candidatus Binataceae bacterium]|nr:response regulator [Candidatus Binataceae bacterium]
LIADHTAINRISIAEMLAAEGALTSVAETSAEVITRVNQAAADKNPFSLVFLDTRLPGLGCHELVNRLSAESPSLRVIPMVTAHDLNEQLPALQKAGLTHQLIKPARLAELLQVIQELLHEAAAHNQAVASLLQRPNLAKEAVSAVEGRITGDNRTSSSPLRVLVADDSADNRILMEAFLKKAGWQMDQAENGQEAVRKFMEGKYDIVLMDIQMPVLNGYDAVRQIREWERATGLPRTPVIALTASVLNEAINKSIEAGCDTHVSKPVRRPALLATIREVVTRHHGDHPDTTSTERFQPSSPAQSNESWPYSQLSNNPSSRIQ